MVMIGLTGKPNVGKSTFFSAATLATVPIANYPFTTKKANIGITYATTKCVCKKLNVKDEPVNAPCVDGVRFIPVRLVDCPGLVPGAWEGRGLGNQFLDEIRRADVLLLVLDVAGSTDEEGRPCKPGTGDPLKDLSFLEEEFDMWIFQVIKKDWDRLSRKAETLKTDVSNLLAEKLAGLQIKKRFIVQVLEELNLQSKKPTQWSEEDLKSLAGRLRRVSKPLLLVANKVDLPYGEENLSRLRETGYPTIPCSAEAELILRRGAEKGLIEYKPGDSDFKILDVGRLSERQVKALEIVRERVLERYGSTGVQEAINFSLFNLLGMVAVYPVEDENKLTDHKGRVLPDCYLVPKDTTVREFAYMIHTELGENFIYAVEAKEKKRVGEDYVVRDGDIIKIVSAKSRG
ncbi:MAG: redox-regulated ATPase YchF [Candidatus Hecatellales archaeon]|nr:MAG: redox-regulated ATPase YchF [Candidatus Hecatellales archaeon]